MRTRWLVWLLPVWLLGTCLWALAEEVVLTTYYPSPRGVYKDMKVVKELTVGSFRIPHAAPAGTPFSVAGTAQSSDPFNAANDFCPAGTNWYDEDSGNDTDSTGECKPTGFLVTPAGNVGIGTPNPASKLAIAGGLGLGAGYAGTAAPTNGLIVEGNVGIGTASPSQKLDVNGQVRIRGGSPDANKVLTSDANGVATWEANSATPSGMIAMFDAACPSGWTRFVALDGKFAMGGSAYGATGGTTEHTHNAPAGYTWGQSGMSVPTGGSDSTPAPSHSANNVEMGMGPQPGASTQGSPTSTSSHLPPYVTVVWCKKD